MKDVTTSENEVSPSVKVECPVCYEEFSDNDLKCGCCGKDACVKCVAKLLVPNYNCDWLKSVGFQYKCPMCRGMNEVNRVQLLVVVTGSWDKMYAQLSAYQLGRCRECLVSWVKYGGNAQDRCTSCNPTPYGPGF